MKYTPPFMTEYYYITQEGETSIKLNTGSEISLKQIEFGNCFKTDKEALEALKRVFEALRSKT